MAFKFVVLAALVAVASAGGPAVYDIAASSGDHSSIGYSQESTQKGYGGQNVISSYTKSDDSAHSYVRVSSQSISNDALLKYDITHTPIVKTAYAAPSYIAPNAAPLIAKTYAEPYSYSTPLLTKAYAEPYSYSAPLLAKTYAAPYSYGSPLLTKTYAASAPIIAKAAIAAPAPLLTKTYAAPSPLLTKTYAAPFAAAPLIAKSYAAPLLTKSYEYAAHAPVYTKSALIAPAHGYAAPLAQAPLLTKTYAAAPLVTKIAHEYAPEAHLVSKAYGYEAASPVVHTVFNGLGTSYSW